MDSQITGSSHRETGDTPENSAAAEDRQSSDDATEELDEAFEGDESIAEDAEAIQPRHSIDQLPDAFWHAPRGPLTKVFAWLILLLIVGCVVAMIVAVMMGAMD